MSESNRILDFLKIIDWLSDVLERESAILRARKPADLETVRQEKLTLSAAYESHVRDLRADASMLAEASLVDRARLKSAFERFETSLGKNERDLRAAKNASDRVLRAIADEVERQRSDNMAYSANGNTGVPTRSATQSPVCVAIDERF
jgi:flagellar biosynthesis/type III secretory pathway chaperone